MNKANFNVVGNKENQELLKGVAFVKSRRAPLNVAQMVMEMNAKTIPNGVMIDTVYADTSSEGDYDRKEIGWLFDVCNIIIFCKGLNEVICLDISLDLFRQFLSIA